MNAVWKVLFCCKWNPDVSNSHDWLELYRIRTSIENRWKRGEHQHFISPDHLGKILTMRVSTITDRVFARFEDSLVREINLETGKQEYQYPCNMGIAIQGKYLATAQSTGEVSLWDVDAHSCVATFSRPSHKKVYGIHIDLDQNRIAIGGKDGAILVHDIETKKVLTEFAWHDDLVVQTHIEEQNTVITGGLDRQVLMGDMRSPSDVKPIYIIRQQTPIHVVRFDAKTLLAGCALGALWVHDRRMQRTWTYKMHARNLVGLHFDGKKIATASGDGTIGFQYVQNLYAESIPPPMYYQIARNSTGIWFDDDRMVVGASNVHLLRFDGKDSQWEQSVPFEIRQTVTS
eukprot:TRINITY_DN4562_c0_g1_i2.p1 TRINITY_DN4562_c0_g1~~TRINITY_DN4562_c0_g1_i2.p1  ORF type:complete len:396 (+),score=68.89 TRINITY_DN4562_c0_g1_i2:154-1188(+)